MSNLSKKLSYRQRALDKLTEDTGVEIEVNEYSDQIFDNKDMDARVATFLSSDPNDRTNAIADMFSKNQRPNIDKLSSTDVDRSGILH
jgi:hypothetical protein